jgi:SAM-dependent methyltransferase
MSSEFDRYARDYHGSIAHPVRALLETSGENEFLRAKARWIDWWWSSTRRPAEARVLDFGCGTGQLTRYLHDLRPGWRFTGVDPSAAMIESARATAPFAAFAVLDDAPEPFAPERFDLVLMSGVCHHMPWETWAPTFGQVRSALDEEGSLLIFEHNPYNPLTQVVVRTTPIDRDAEMRTAGFVRRALVGLGFEVEAVRYLHFFPPRLRALAALERGLAWLPVGSQYLVQACLPAGRARKPVPAGAAGR